MSLYLVDLISKFRFHFPLSFLASWGMAATKPEERKESAIRTERCRHQGTTTGLLSVKLIHIAD